MTQVNFMKKIRGETRGCIIAILAILAVGAAFFALLFSPLPDSRARSDLPFDHESDEAAIHFFLSHQDSFEDLRVRLEKQTTLVYYDLQRDEASPETALASDNAQRQIIRQIMKNLGLSALNGPASSWGLRMIFQSEGMVTAGSTKSFYFSRVTPQKIVPSIENFVIDAPESEGVYRNIVPNWYLKLDWGG